MVKMNHYRFLSHVAQVGFLGSAMAMCFVNVVTGTMMLIISISVLVRKVRYK